MILDDDWDAFDAPPPVASTSSGSGAKQHVLFTDDLSVVKNGDTSRLLRKKKKSVAAAPSSISLPKSNKGKGKAVAALNELDAQAEARAEADRIAEAAVRLSDISFTLVDETRQS